MDENTTRFRILHGIVKGAIRNIIDLAHSRIPKDSLITDGKNRVNQPELANINQAFEEMMDKFDACHHKGFRDCNSGKLLYKAKEVGMSALASDTAYYIMMEYYLKSYVHLKMDDAFGHEAVEKAFMDQWWKRRNDLVENQEGVQG